MIEHAASVVSEENTELACSFIQKTAVERVLPEMDKRLSAVSVKISCLNFSKLPYFVTFTGLGEITFKCLWFILGI